MYEDNYLIHYGIPRRSGRYPWGSGDRPYQGDDAVVKKKKRGFLTFRRDKKVEKMEKSLAKLSPEEYEKRKQEVLKTGTATEVLLFKYDLTTNQMNNAINRINAERRLADISKDEFDESWKTVDRLMKKVKDVKEWSDTAIGLYGLIDKQLSKSGSKSSNSNKGPNKK